MATRGTGSTVRTTGAIGTGSGMQTVKQTGSTFFQFDNPRVKWSSNARWLR